MSKTDIRLCGLGGQGVIMTGMVLGKAASIFEKKWSTMIQSFGPEARGSTCSAQVMISDEKIGYPYIRKSDVFLAFSQSAYEKFVDEVKPGGILVYESELVTPDERLADGVSTFGIPGTRITRDDVGRMIVFNMVMLGFLTASTSLCSLEAVKSAVLDSVPAGTEDLNIRALLAGYNYQSPR